MQRDLWLYLQALRRHLVGLAAGSTVTVVLLVWQYVLKKGDIPTWALWVAVSGGLFISGFQAWREEHGRVIKDVDGQLREKRERLQALASKMVDEYVALARPRHDAGPHALATLGLDLLESDALIRDAIRQMQARTSTDPWSGQASQVEDVDLVRFFELVRRKNVDFLRQSTVSEIASEVRAAGWLRPKVVATTRG